MSWKTRSAFSCGSQCSGIPAFSRHAWSVILTQTQFAAVAKLFEFGRCSQNHLGRLIYLDAAAATIRGVARSPWTSRWLSTVDVELNHRRHQHHRLDQNRASCRRASNRHCSPDHSRNVGAVEPGGAKTGRPAAAKDDLTAGTMHSGAACSTPDQVGGRLSPRLRGEGARISWPLGRASILWRVRPIPKSAGTIPIPLASLSAPPPSRRAGRQDPA